MQSQTKKINNISTKWITILGVICCFAVFMLHANGRFWSIDVTHPNWIEANAVESLAFFAVPCFFMISGATLIGYRDRYDTKTYFKHRIKRCFIPYLIYSIGGMIAFFIINKTPGPDIPIKIFDLLFLGQQLNYWFFPILFILYLLIPIIANIRDEKARMNICWGIVIVGFIATFLVPFVVNVCSNPIVWPYDFTLLIYPLVYACCGYILRKIDFPKWADIIIFVLGTGGMLAQLLGTQFLSLGSGVINDLFKGYSNVPCFFYAIGVALFIKKISVLLIKWDFCIKAFDFVSKTTLSIYLLHTMLLMGFGIIYNNIWNIPNSSPIFVWTVGLFVLPSIILFVWLIRKIPKIQKVLVYLFP